VNVGTKELKNRLSHYLRRVRAGEVLRVMDRDVVVAEVRRVDPPASDEKALLRELEDAGQVTMGSGKLEDFEPIRVRGKSLGRDILDQRR
jgi:antitoxin (DNA-binding transcriptional repressor) of toxin-antitoxin stability system